MKNKKNLIIGYGRLGQKIHIQNQKNAEWVTIRKHTKEPLASFNQDILSIDLKVLGDIDTIIFCMAPHEYSESAYFYCYVQSLRYVLEHTSFKKIIFCSSSGVYHQNNGEFVDELSITSPSHFSGRILLEAEKLIQEIAPSYDILRLSGLYDGSRSPPSSWKNFSTWTNRIHLEDATNIISILLNKNIYNHSTFCITDDLPFIPKEIAALFYLNDNLSFKSDRIISSKKVLNSKIKKYLDYEFIYPTIFEGYKNYLRG